MCVCTWSEVQLAYWRLQARVDKRLEVDRREWKELRSVWLRRKIKSYIQLKLKRGTQAGQSFQPSHTIKLSISAQLIGDSWSVVVTCEMVVVVAVAIEAGLCLQNRSVTLQIVNTFRTFNLQVDAMIKLVLACLKQTNIRRLNFILTLLWRLRTNGNGNLVL